MNERSSEQPSEQQVEALVELLRRKEGTWVEWGHACQRLQQAGWRDRDIFERTGFEPTHQNQVIVAAQVYDGLARSAVPPSVLEAFATRGSDILYELRVLPQDERAKAAEFALDRALDATATREMAKAMKEMKLLGKSAPEFSAHPGDALAYQAWKAARSTTEPQARARAISRGLQYAHTPSARAAIEALLTAIVAPTPARPLLLPVYRLQEDDNLPRVLPVAGRLPLSIEALQAVPLVPEIAPFGMVQFDGTCAWVALPGWQAVRQAEDGIVLLCDTDTLAEVSGQRLPNSFPDRPEEIVVLLDRARRAWEGEGYYAVAREGQLVLQGCANAPGVPLLGRVVLVLRQPRILDEHVSSDPWHVDE